MKKIIAFDFDGTLTKKDTFIEFIKFSKGSLRFYINAPFIGFVWYLSKLKIIKTHNAKAFVFSIFFKGESLIKFDKYCFDFINKIESNLRDDAKVVIEDHFLKGNEVIIVSASVENWIKPWAKANGINMVLATKIETNNQGKLTGKFATKNCIGDEKVKRFLGVFPNRELYHLTVYGDSKGDKNLMSIADKTFWKTLK
ncbi:HAD-IB family hydrolase [Winogradskyella sp. SM1960]|uniref:HAD-IB family hydrolase n=1 Tax=Winogradskyella sp. SM1960 TaxID=2865955 RepID=UPI001CD3E074|nr:HAD-IB family hydrolase [Winogradskyella sp. SM1960]